MFSMKYQSFIKSLFGVGLVLALSACAAQPPYVFQQGEFQRDSRFYLEGVTDLQEVKVCYTKRGTTPKQVTEVAQNACAQFSKKAIFREQSYRVCPIVTPIAAVYDCVDDAPRRNSYNLITTY